jgi:TetR/AcrR family transcriptional regulator, transcriptional repressor for nem operon
VSEFIDLTATQLRAGSAAARRRNAAAIHGMMVGMLQLARAVNDRRLSDEILENGVSAALALVNDAR